MRVLENLNIKILNIRKSFIILVLYHDVDCILRISDVIPNGIEQF